MIPHLLKTDWLRLRWLILGTWAILFLAVLPWLLHDPGSFKLPWTEAAQGNDASTSLLFTLKSILLRQISLYAVAGSTLLLATAIGMHDFHWQRVTPIRVWERLAAKVLAVLLFIVAPQVLLGMGVMWKQGYSTPVALGAAAGIALSLALLHGTAAVFGRQCGSFWIWAPAVACLAAAIYLPFLANQFFPTIMAPAVSALRSLTFFLDAWAETSGPTLWVYLGLTLVAAGGIPRLLRTRPGTIPAVVAAVGGLVLAGVAAPWLSPGRRIAELSIPSLRPFIAPGDLQIQQGSHTGLSGRTSFQTSVQARISTEGKADGKFVRWIPYGGTVVNLKPSVIRVMMSSAGNAALRDALPAPLASPPSSFEDAESLPIAAEHVTVMPVAGIAFHYETLTNLPLSETPVSSTKGDTTATARLHFDSSTGPLPELILRLPTRDADWKPEIGRLFSYGSFYFYNQSFSFALHLPKQNVCIGLWTKIGQYTPIPGGGAYARYVLEADNLQMLDRKSFEGARLIVLRPVIDGVLMRQLELPPIPPTDWQRRGVRLDQGTNLSESDYLTEFRPNRPDPATCTEEEFDRYLQAVGNTWPGSTLQEDLAEYAPRFPQVLSRFLSSQNVMYALGDIVAESDKAAVISAIDSPQHALDAAQMLARRGWQYEAREPLLECLRAPFLTQHGGVVYPVIAALAELEDPTTYQALVSAYESTGRSDYYKIIRPLPGIKPQLDAAVERMSGKLKTSLLEFTSFSSAISDALETYEACVSHGNTTALTKLLEFWENLPFGSIGELDETPAPDENKDDPDKQPQFSVMASGDVGGSAPNLVLKDFTRFFRIDPPIPHTLDAWRAYMAGKTAADFSYDPLSRRWRASSLTN